MATKETKKFRNRYDEAKKKLKYGTQIQGKSLTNVAIAEELDIKLMCKKYGLNSVLARTEVTEAMYGWDLTNTTDLAERLEIRERMKQYYDTMPAIVRKKFGDNYNKFYEMYAHGDHKLMKELGIIKEETNENINVFNGSTETNNQINNNESTTTNDVDNKRTN